MRWFKQYLILILVSTLFISGCISMDVNQKINKDGTSEIEIVYDFSAILGMAEQFGNDSEQFGNDSEQTGTGDLGMGGFSMSGDFGEDFTQACEGFDEKTKLENAGCEATEDYKTIISVNTSLKDDPAFEVSRSIPYITYKYDVKNIYKVLSGVGGVGGSQEEEFSDKQLKEAKAMKGMGIEFGYTLEMPGKISEADVGEVKENKVVIDMFDFIGKEHVYVESRQLNLLFDSIIAAIILILIVGGVIFLMFKRGGGTPQEQPLQQEQQPSQVQQPVQKEPLSFDQQLLDHINSCRQQGYSEDKIRRILVEKDKYPAEKIDQLMSQK